MSARHVALLNRLTIRLPALAAMAIAPLAVLRPTLAEEPRPEDVPPDDFPRFLVPGHEPEMESLRRLFWLHYRPAGPLIPLWDEWMPQSTLWPALGTGPALDATRLRWAAALAGRGMNDEGYVHTHQHDGLAHAEGWPFPLWTQAGGIGWHFRGTGVPGYDASVWFGVFTNAGVPAPIVTRLHEEVMKALSTPELKARMAAIIVGYDPLGAPVRAGDIGVEGAMAALMKHAMQPNLVQTIEGVPAFVHGGPFANIAHGCNTLVATKLARKLGDYTVTEAGFGADLGAEKFFHIKCRIGGMSPSAAVLVVTRRAFAVHGLANVRKHVENLARFGVPVVISINRFLGDPDAELAEILAACRDLGAPAAITDYREAGGAGGLELAELVVAACEQPAQLSPLYPLEMPIAEKVRCLAETLYGADGVDFSPDALRDIKQITNLGYGGLPICVAKTPNSLSDDPNRPGCPSGFRLTVSGARVSAGAGFVVIYTGKIMTMPGLPRRPAALDIDVDSGGRISGLF